MVAQDFEEQQKHYASPAEAHFSIIYWDVPPPPGVISDNYP